MWKDLLSFAYTLLLGFAAISSLNSGKTSKILYGFVYLSLALMSGTYFVVSVFKLL